MHNHKVKPLHNNIGIFNIKYLKNLIPFISLFCKSEVKDINACI